MASKSRDILVVQKILEEYGKEAIDEVTLLADEIMKEGVAKMKSVDMPMSSASGTSNTSKRRSWKKYSSGWSGQLEKKDGKVKATIFNKSKGNQTSWLEYGHATRDGKTTRAFVHIEPVEKELNKRFEEGVKGIFK